MKTIAKMMCIFMFIGFVAKSHAQKKEETVTHYYYTLVYLEGKNVGITPVLSSTVEKYTYLSTCMRGLEMYLMDYVPAETNHKIDHSLSKPLLSGSGATYSDADKRRLQDIKQFKEKGYNIIHLNRIGYRCEG